MKHLNIRPFWLTLCVVLILFGMYYLPTGSIGEKQFRRIDILADLRPDKATEEDCLSADTLFTVPIQKPNLWTLAKQESPVSRTMQTPPRGA